MACLWRTSSSTDTGLGTTRYPSTPPSTAPASQGTTIEGLPVSEGAQSGGFWPPTIAPLPHDAPPPGCRASDGSDCTTALQPGSREPLWGGSALAEAVSEDIGEGPRTAGAPPWLSAPAAAAHEHPWRGCTDGVPGDLFALPWHDSVASAGRPPRCPVAVSAPWRAPPAAAAQPRGAAAVAEAAEPLGVVSERRGRRRSESRAGRLAAAADLALCPRRWSLADPCVRPLHCKVWQRKPVPLLSRPLPHLVACTPGPFSVPSGSLLHGSCQRQQG